MSILVDCFCGIGGAAKGYSDAGFDVVGIDNMPQPRYPFRFIKGDAMAALDAWANGDPWGNIDPEQVDVIHASPPCPSYSTLTNRRPSKAPKLIPVVRTFMKSISAMLGTLYVIESVEGAKSDMEQPFRLHGGMFGQRIYRPRLFETNAVLHRPPRGRRPVNPVAIYGDHEDGRLLRTRVDGSELRAASLEEAQTAMAMPWADWSGIKDAVPPVYTRWIGRQLLENKGEVPLPTLADQLRALAANKGRVTTATLTAGATPRRPTGWMPAMLDDDEDEEPVLDYPDMALRCPEHFVKLWFDAPSGDFYCPSCSFALKVIDPHEYL